MNEANSTGVCRLVGAGPGDPGLLTRRGAECLARADVVYYDHLADDALLALAPEGAERIYVGKRAGAHAVPQEAICDRLVRDVSAGREVVRLKGGDPFVFGRGGEEALALARAGLRFEIVPGVTAGVAAPACAGIPFTHRGLAVSAAFVTGHEDPAKTASAVDWAALAGVDTLSVYMGVGRVATVAEALLRAGRPADQPAAAVEWGCTPRQRTVAATLGTLADRMAADGVGPPAILVFGEVVRLREELAWMERRPLHGRRVLVTRTRRQAGALSAELRALGAEAVELPVIRIRPPADPDALDDAVAGIGGFDWLVFTSPNGVAACFDRLEAMGRDARALGGVRVAVIGRGTADALAGRGVRADLAPERFVAEGLLESLLAAGDVAGRRILLLRAEAAREVLPDGLRAAGADVTVVAAYRTEPADDADPAALDALADGRIDAVTFASSSTVEHFVALLRAHRGARPAELSPPPKWISIGPVTTATMRAHGLEPDAEADPHDIPGLARAAAAGVGQNRSPGRVPATQLPPR